MTPDDTKRVLGYMLAAWPSHKLDEVGALVWAEHLADVPAEQAVEIARKLVADHPWFPSISEFRGIWKRQNQRDRQQFALPAPESPRLSSEEVRDRIDAMKALLPHAERPDRPRYPIPLITEDNDPGLLAARETEDA